MGCCDFQRRQRGAILIVVLVCLAVAAAMSVVVVRQIAAERHVVQMNHRSLQALWLAEAGVERAAARLAADPKYAGETWTIPAEELAAGKRGQSPFVHSTRRAVPANGDCPLFPAADDGAVVRIQVETIAGQSERRSVRVEADYPDAPERRCRQVKQIVVDRGAVLSRQPTKAPK
jgi:hypothetical protein